MPTGIMKDDIDAREQPVASAPQGPHVFVAGERVAIDAAKSKPGWLWISADGREGFVREKWVDIVPDEPPPAPVSLALSQIAFARSCLMAADDKKTNAGLLIALAYTESSADWIGDDIVASPEDAQGGLGAFRFGAARWAALVANAPTESIIVADRANSQRQTTLAAIAAAANAATFGNDPARPTVLDLYLGHHLGPKMARALVDGDRARALSAALLATPPSDQAERDAFLGRHPGFSPNGEATTVAEFVAACVEALKLGLAKALALIATVDERNKIDFAGDPPVQPGETVPRGQETDSDNFKTGRVDRQLFFDRFSRIFRKNKEVLTSQRDCCNLFFDFWDAHDEYVDPRWLAYILGTVYGEVGSKMEPVREGFKPTDAESIAHVKRLLAKGKIKKDYSIPEDNGESYFGRGFVQLTWAKNYIEMGDRIGVGRSLYDNPSLALDPKISVPVTAIGMVEGFFRGDGQGRHTLSRYFNATTEQWSAARNIVNSGSDRPAEIAGYAQGFYVCLTGTGL